MLRMTVLNAPNGRYRAKYYDSASCVACNKGKYLSGNVASDHARRKQIVKYVNKADILIKMARASCKWCSAGKYISDHMTTQNKHDAWNDCAKCPNGRYRTQEYDSASCVACNAGKYLSGNVASDHASGTNCKICQQSRYTNQNGRTVVSGVVRKIHI